MLAPAIGCISPSTARKLSSSWPEVTNPRKPQISKTTRYDVAEHLFTPQEVAAYLEACLEEANGDAAFIAKALSGDRAPSFDTILKVVGALGLKVGHTRTQQFPCTHSSKNS